MTEEISPNVLICGAGLLASLWRLILPGGECLSGLIEKMDDAFRGRVAKVSSPQSGDFRRLRHYRPSGRFWRCLSPQREYREMADTKNRSSSSTNTRRRMSRIQSRFWFPSFDRSCDARAAGGTWPQAAIRLRANEFYTGPRKRCLPSLECFGVESLRVRYLVALTAAGASCGHALNVGFPGKTLRVRAVVADVILDGLGRDAWHRSRRLDESRCRSARLQEPNCSSCKRLSRSKAKLT